jgi:hypothetical protein
MSLRIALLAFLAAGCTVSVGKSTDAGACSPSTAYFASTFWLGYVDPNHCAASSCHAFSDGHGYLRYLPPGDIPAPGVAFADWPAAWRANYYQSVQFMNCAEPLQSRLLTVPEGNADPHPPGPSVMMPQVAEELFQDWVSAP